MKKIQLNKKFSLFLSFLLVSTVIFSQSIFVEDYRAKGKSDREMIQDALDQLQKQGHGKIEFDGSKTYQIDNCLQLPTYNDDVSSRTTFIIEGNGCILEVKNNEACGFFRKPKNQNEALNKMMRYRFLIQNFTINGGAKGIELCATYGSKISNCSFTGQKVAAIDIQFGLNTIIEHCYATNCIKDNFIVRTGEDWGGSGQNSQSNHSIFKSCRVYAKEGANSAFKILGSSGVKLENIISEGSSEINYAVYVNKQKSNTVRMFAIENFHLEHAPKKAAFYFNSTGIVELDKLFYQISRKNEEFNLIHGENSTQQITLKNIPHFVGGTVMKQTKSGGGISWHLIHCHKAFFDAKNWRITDRKTKEVKKELPYYFKGEGYLYQIDKNY